MVMNENVWSSYDRNDLFRANKRSTHMQPNRLNREQNNFCLRTKEVNECIYIYMYVYGEMQIGTNNEL